MTLTFEVCATYSYHEETKRNFRTSELWRVWADRFPMLFDAVDREVVCSQADISKGGAHFHEWLAAIRLYESTGWLSLVEQYQYSKNAKARHWTKRPIIERLSDPKLLTAIYDYDVDGTQCPDLLAYRADFTDWAFIDAKGPGDKVRPNQVRRWSWMSQITGKPISQIRLKVDNTTPIE